MIITPPNPKTTHARNLEGGTGRFVDSGVPEETFVTTQCNAVCVGAWVYVFAARGLTINCRPPRPVCSPLLCMPCGSAWQSSWSPSALSAQLLLLFGLTVASAVAVVPWRSCRCACRCCRRRCSCGALLSLSPIPLLFLLALPLRCPAAALLHSCVPIVRRSVRSMPAILKFIFSHGRDGSFLQSVS